MPDQKNMPVTPGSKHYRSFWPIVIILVITVVLCGFILYFAQNNITDDEVNSINFAPLTYLRKISRKMPVMQKKPLVKAPATTTPTTSK